MKTKRIVGTGVLALLIMMSGNLIAEEVSYVGARSAGDDGGPPFSGAVMVGDTLYV